MKQKIVINVQMTCDKCRSKALKIAAVANGVVFVGLEGEARDQVVVIGENVDAVSLTSLLRKKVGHAVITSISEDKPKENVTEVKEKEPEAKAKSNGSIVPINYHCYDYPQYGRYEYNVIYHNANPGSYWW